MGKYFGTDGFRGEANVVLTAEHAFKVGRFLGWYYGGRLERTAQSAGSPGRIVIGRDTRRSGSMFECALAAGITASGADAWLMHVTTTPGVSYAVRTEGFDCGIMISASHNPYCDNGIKVINGKGEKLEDALIREIEDYLDGGSQELPLAARGMIGRTVDFSAGQDLYINYLISIAAHSFAGKRIALDCANGSASPIAKRVFDGLGAQTCVINSSPDGLNINAGCGSTHIDGLCRFVKENRCDAGFAYDGDADRCIAVDENGNTVNGDLILYICGRYMKENGSLAGDTVVTTVMSNFGLYRAFDQAGISYAKTAVGDRYVYENMAKYGRSLGGEQSGHIIFSRYAATGDGILTSLKVMEVMLEKEQPLSRLAAPVHIYPQVLKNVLVRDKQAAQDDGDVQAEVKKAEESLGGTGRVLLRQSGTEPVVRVMAEAGTREICERCVDQVIAVMKAKGHVL